MKKYFISFVEEFWMPSTNFMGAGKIREDIGDFITGRVEVFDNFGNSEYNVMELRFFTKDKSFYDFRERWDYEDITKEELNKLKKIIKKKYNNVL